MPSIKDIANALNVSTTAVSMALNDKPGLGEHTRQMILQTAESMGYQSKSKKQPVAGSIALVYLRTFSSSIEYDTPIFSQLISGVSDRAQELKYNLMVSTCMKNDISAAATVKNAGCAGAILLISEADGNQDLSILEHLDLPVVILDMAYTNYPVDVISANHFQGANLATQYLISLGHTELCFFRGDIPQASAFMERYLGYQLAVQSHEQTRHCVNNSIVCNRNFNDLAVKISNLPSMPTAFVCAGDWYALECIHALQYLGYRVPDDVSVIGFDNTPLCEVSSPKITTMDVPLQKMGALAVNRLLDVITCRTSGENVSIKLYAKLVVRESTGPVKAQNPR